MAESRMTRDHGEIRRWAEARGGTPAAARGAGHGNDPGLLRIDFADSDREEEFEPLPWDEFFGRFDENHLVFLYQEEAEGGRMSRFHEFLRERTARETEEGEKRSAA